MRPTMSIAQFAGRVSVKGTNEFDAALPNRWPARVVARAGSKSFEETVIRAPFDADGDEVSFLLTEKWRRIGTDELETADGSYAMIWRQIAERIAARAG